MVPEALKLVIPPPVYSVLSVIGTILFVYLCIIVISIMLSLIVIALVCEFVWTPWHERTSIRDPEARDERLVEINTNGMEWHDHATFYQAVVLHNLRVLEILDSIVVVLEERREQRQQREREQVVGDKMPPPVSYGSEGIEIDCKDCVICMEDFEKDQLCQVFPSCKHTFHSKCMNTWLKKSPTYPICRNCVTDFVIFMMKYPQFYSILCCYSSVAELDALLFWD